MVAENRVRQLCYVAYAAALLVFVLSLFGPDLLYKSGTRPVAPVAGDSPPSSGLQTHPEPEVRAAAQKRRPAEGSTAPAAAATGQTAPASGGGASGGGPLPKLPHISGGQATNFASSIKALNLEPMRAAIPRADQQSRAAQRPQPLERPAAQRSPSAKIVAGMTPPKSEGRYGDWEGHCHMEWTNNACPGTYDVRIRPEAANVWPFPKYQEEWRKALGDRLLAASQGQLTDEACQGFFMWGDYVWCNYAVEPGSGAPRPPDPLREGTDVVGMSVGIRERDPWSELMGNRYKMATHLYDCYWGTGGNAEQTQTRGPLGFGAAPDRSAVQNIAGKAACPPRKTMLNGCYEMPYEAHRVCLSQSTKTKRAVTGLHKLLEGRPPLSAHIKIDCEGAEWEELADLVANPEDCAKIRTLDMEVHYNLGDIGVHSVCDQETLTKRVETMEKLSEIFAVTGSTFRALLENEGRLSNKSGGIDGGQHCIVTSGGWHLDQYCISFTNRELLAE